MYGVLTEPIRPRDTAGELLGGLAVAGAGLLVATLDGIESGQLEARPQPAEGVSLAPKITIDDARVRWETRPRWPWTGGSGPARRAGRVDHARRGQDQALAAGRAAGPAAAAGRSGVGQPLAPGELRVQRTSVLVGTATEPVELGDVQPPGKRRMPAADWARGLRQTAAVLA